MYIYAKNTINMYAWTLYTPINDFYMLCIESVRHIQILLYIYIYLASTSLHVHTPELQSILRSTTTGHVYDPAARQIFESALKERYAYVQ